MRLRLIMIAAAILALMAVPAVSGATIAYVKWTKAGGNQPIWVAADNGTSARQLSATGFGPEISPNGRWIAYEAISNSKTWSTQLAFVNVASGVVIQTNMACNGPVWSPDSSMVACSTISENAKGILNGSGLMLVTPSAQTTVIVPAKGRSVGGYSFSPDSTRIAYGVQSFPGTLTGMQLRNSSVTGGSTIRLGRGSNPVWGPQRIAYVRTSMARWHGTNVVRQQVWTVTSGSARSARKLTSYPAKGLMAGPAPVAWTPDGSRLIGALVGEDSLRSIWISASSGRLKGFGPRNAFPVAVSADGTQALVNTNQLGGVNEAVIAAPLSGGSTVKIASSADSASASASWQP